MASPPGANRVSDVLHRGAHAVVNHVRRAPATHAYVFTLLVTTAVVHTLDRRVADELLRQVSTNLYEMGRDALRVLLLSGNGGIILFEDPEALVQKVDRIVANKEMPLIIIDNSEGKIDLSILQYPLWLAFAPDPNQQLDDYREYR